jgi:hypothetical protein
MSETHRGITRETSGITKFHRGITVGERRITKRCGEAKRWREFRYAAEGICYAAKRFRYAAV